MDIYVQKKMGFEGFSPRRIVLANSINPLNREKVSTSTRAIKQGSPVITAANNTLDRVAVQGTNEVQTITITGTPTGGTFTITSAITGSSAKTASGNFTGTTVAIARNATAAVVQAALETILGEGNVVCGGGPFPGTPVSVTFRGELSSTNVAALTTTDSFTGGSSPASAVTTATAGVTGLVTSTVLLGFSLMNDTNPLPTWPGMFAPGITNFDGPYGNSAKPITVHPAYSGEIFQGCIWPTETVTAGLVDNAYSLGWNLDEECVYIRTGDTSNAIVRIVGIMPGELGKVGGVVDFVVVDGASAFH